MMDSARSESGPFPQKIFLRNQSARTPVVPRLSLAKLKGDGTTLAASKLAVDERLGAASSVTTVSAPPVSCGATFVELEPFLDDDNEDSPEAEADVRHCSKSVPLACISSEGDVSPLVLPLTSKLASVPSSSSFTKTDTNSLACTDTNISQNQNVNRFVQNWEPQSFSDHWRSIREQMEKLQKNLLNSYNLSGSVDLLIKYLDEETIDRVSIKNELQILRGYIDTAAVSIENFVKAFELSQTEVSRLESLALDQWHQMSQIDGEKAALKSEIQGLQRERDTLIGHKFYAEQLKSQHSQPIIQEYLNRIQEVLDEKKNVELTAKQLQEELLQRDRMLIEAKMSLADEKTKSELSNKLIRYYVKHLESCDPSYIIPVLDRKRLEDLQIADIEEGHLRRSKSRKNATEPSPSKSASLRLLKSLVNSPLVAMGLGGAQSEVSPTLPSRGSSLLPSRGGNRSRPDTNQSTRDTASPLATLRISTYKLDERPFSPAATETNRRRFDYSSPPPRITETRLRPAPLCRKGHRPD